MTSEFAAIDSIRSLLGGTSLPGEVWIGDDAAVLRSEPGWMLLAADTVVGGVHAALDLVSLDDLGWKAMAASVSDIAAMGGEPGHAVVSVAAPPGTDLMLLYRGIAAAADAFRCPVVGGDLTNSGDIVVTVAVTGRCGGEPVRRSGARPGDLIWVTGPLGGSAAGLRQLRSPPPPEGSDPSRREEAAGLYRRPVPQLGAGRAARGCGATAMIDVSDGLAADLDHVATSSGVGIRLDRVPVHPAATLEEAMSGGEDFALAFCAPESAAVVEAFVALDTPVLVGRCTEDPAERSLAGKPFEVTGWQHRW